MPLRRGTVSGWVVAKVHPSGNGWHWDSFFDEPHDGYAWGGPDWIRSPQSFNRIRQMRRDDLVIAYQGGEGVVAFTRLKSEGKRASGSRNFDCFDLNPRAALRHRHPVPLAAIKLLPDASATFEFVRSGRGTVHRVESGGFEQVLGLAMAFNSSQATELWRLHPAG